MALVAFLDILGTKEQVLADEFSDFHSLDFSNAVGLAAHLAPDLRFAVFSDSVIVSAEENAADIYVKALGYMYSNWFGDFILVRGAISIGEIIWVNDIHNDPFFRKMANFMYARVYGKGLVTAHQLEQKSGPGAVCFLAEEAVEVLRTVHPHAVINASVPCLGWAGQRMASIIRGYMERELTITAKGTERRRHLVASKSYWDNVVESKTFLPIHLQFIPDNWPDLL